MASAAPAAAALRADCGSTAPLGGPAVARSSGAPAPRPPGPPNGCSPTSALMLGAPAGAPTEPSVCGAPGAFGFCTGSKASPRFAGPAAGAEDGFCGRTCAPGRGAASSCMRRIWPSSCWLRNCNCSIVPVSCRIWVSRRSRRSTRSGPDICAMRSAPAGGAPGSPPRRSLPLKRPNNPNGRSFSWAQASHTTKHTAIVVIRTSADADVTRNVKRVMALCGVGALQTGYESLRPNCDCGPLTKFTIPARQATSRRRLFHGLARGRGDFARFAPFLEPLRDCEERRHEQHR